MSHAIEGTDTFPDDFLIPDDGDARSASSINVALEALADRTFHLKKRLLVAAQVVVIDYLAPQNVVVPAGVTVVHARGWGAGGAGGAGATAVIGSTYPDHSAPGGGGGGGAQERVDSFLVTPGDTLVCTIGGGVAGSPGGDTVITRSGSELARFAGGGLGYSGIVVATTEDVIAYGVNGNPYGAVGCASFAAGGPSASVAVATPLRGIVLPGNLGAPPPGASEGGWGSTKAGTHGGASTRGYAGGAGGAAGTGGGGGGQGPGGGGGGGGAGPGGPGAAGGAGGGIVPGAANGAAGANAGDYTGAGGGGGGGGGQYIAPGAVYSMGTGATGGAGGSGALILTFLKEV